MSIIAIIIAVIVTIGVIAWWWNSLTVSQLNAFSAAVQEADEASKPINRLFNFDLYVIVKHATQGDNMALYEEVSWHEDYYSNLLSKLEADVIEFANLTFNQDLVFRYARERFRILAEEVIDQLKQDEAANDAEYQRIRAILDLPNPATKEQERITHE